MAFSNRNQGLIQAMASTHMSFSLFLSTAFLKDFFGTETAALARDGNGICFKHHLDRVGEKTLSPD